MVDIKDLIQKRGMRQAEVARAIGIRPQYLHAIIVGERPLPIRYVVPLCKYLGITPNVLFGYERMFVPTDSDHEAEDSFFNSLKRGLEQAINDDVREITIIKAEGEDGREL